MDVYTVRQTEIEEFLIAEHNARKNDLLVSFDWDVRHIMGTSNSVALRTHIATLIFNCKASGTSEPKTLHMELSRQRVDQLIDILEKLDEQMSSNG